MIELDWDELEEQDCCDWDHIRGDNYWRSECGTVYNVARDEIEEGYYNFCPQCGKEINLIDDDDIGDENE